MPDHVEISTDPSRLDLDWIVRQLQGSYWGGHMSADQIGAAVSRSLCFGAYVAGTQVGLVRVVTDSSIFSSVTDVIVQEDHRSQGIGTALMTAAMEHEDVRKTICILRARGPAVLWYWKNWDFKLMDRQHGIMSREPKA